MLFAELDEIIYLGPPTTTNRSGGGGRRGLRPARRHPATAVFWDAHVWCDVLRSVEDDRPAFPWGFGHAGRSEVWQRRLGYRRAQFSDKFIRMRSRTRAQHSSPYAPPDEPHASEWAALATRGHRLGYMPLCAPRRYRVWGDSPRARQAAARGGGRGCLRSGSLLLAPPWLVSQGERPGVDWAVAAPPQAAYMHLVNMWRCFGQDHCYTKHNKRWWLRANGLWDRRLDALPAAPRAVPSGAPSPGNGSEARPLLAVAPELVRRVASAGQFVHLHRLLHNLLTLAPLLGRVALLPELPCAFFRRASRRAHRASRHANASRLGVSLNDVLVVGRTADRARCFVFPGGLDCAEGQVVHPFEVAPVRSPVEGAEPEVATAHTPHTGDSRDGSGAAAAAAEAAAGAAAGAAAEAAPRLRYGGAAPPGGDGAYAPASLAALGATCRAAAAQRGAPLLLLHGLDPLGDTVVDSARPLPPRASAEFVSVLSGRAGKQALAAGCAGTQAWRALGRRCPFYFLRERDAVSRQTHRSVSLSFADRPYR